MAMNTPRRIIKVSVRSNVQADHYKQKIINHNTGKTSIIDETKPISWTKTVTILGNPQDPENYHSHTESKGDPIAEETKTKKLDLRQ